MKKQGLVSILLGVTLLMAAAVLWGPSFRRTAFVESEDERTSSRGSLANDTRPITKNSQGSELVVTQESRAKVGSIGHPSQMDHDIGEDDTSSTLTSAGTGDVASLQDVVSAKTLTLSEFKDALTIAQAIENSETRHEEFHKLISLLEEEGLSHLLMLSLDIDTEEDRKAFLQSAIALLAKIDPASLVMSIDQLFQDEMRIFAIHSVAEKWSETDPSTAAFWFEDFLGPDNVAAARSPNDQQGILLGSTISSQVVGVIARNWAQQNCEEASSWVGALSNGDAKTEACISLMREWGKKDPVAASVWAESLEDGDARINAISNLAITWAKEDPKNSSVWFGELYDAGDRNLWITFDDMASELAKENSQDASIWVEYLPDVESKLWAYHSVVDEWVKKDVDSATLWADSAPEEYRNSVMERIGWYMIENQKEDATQWILDSQLSEDVKERLLTSPKISEFKKGDLLRPSNERPPVQNPTRSALEEPSS
jgi:hypothetical protein